MRRGVRRVGAALVAAGAFALVPACSTSTAPTGPAVPVVPVERSAPAAGWQITAPSIGMTSSLTSVGLNPDRTIETPPVSTPEQAALYRFGPAPGEVGPAVVLCHVNGDGRPGCGARFDDLRTGDRVEVARPTGTRVVFEVYRVESWPKGDFRTSAVYDDTAGPELRLITCGGALDRNARSYVENVVVFAKEVRT